MIENPMVNGAYPYNAEVSPAPELLHCPHCGSDTWDFQISFGDGTVCGCSDCEVRLYPEDFGQE